MRKGHDHYGRVMELADGARAADLRNRVIGADPDWVPAGLNELGDKSAEAPSAEMSAGEGQAR